MFETIPQTLITTYLEMTSPSQFKPAYVNRDDARIERMQAVDTGFYRYLYRAVGEKWAWRDRLEMPERDLRDWLQRSTTAVYVLYVTGAPAGYIELSDAQGDVEVVYFGLRQEYMGRGLGKHLLSVGVQHAWDMGAHRVWLHTCNLDGPHALSNYRKRGFAVYMRYEEPMPDIYQ